VSQEALSHLNAPYRAYALLSASERVQWIRQDRWIHYSRAEQVLNRLSDLLTYPARDRISSMTSSHPLLAMLIIANCIQDQLWVCRLNKTRWDHYLSHWRFIQCADSTRRLSAIDYGHPLHY